MTADKLPPNTGLRAQLELSVERGSYDVQAGLARHRGLIDQGAALPTWAEGMGQAGARSLWRGRALMGLGVLMLGALGLYAIQSGESDPGHDTATAVQAVPVLPHESLAQPDEQSAARAVESVQLPQRDARATPAKPRTSPARAAQAASKAKQSSSVDELELLAAASTSANAPAAQRRGKAASPVIVGTLPSTPTAESAASAAASPEAAPRARNAGEQSTFQRVQVQAAERPAVVVEMEELSRAEKLLAKDPAAALAQVRKSSAKYPGGFLEQERRYVEIMATLGLRRVEEARLLGRDFVRAYPQSPYRRRVESAVTSAIRAQ